MMDRLISRNTFSPFTASLMLIGALSLNTVQADEHYTYLVSVQDSNDQHLCNGSYIGNNQILFSPDCQSLGVIFPPPFLNTAPVTDQSVIVNGSVMSENTNLEPGIYNASGMSSRSNLSANGTLIINDAEIPTTEYASEFSVNDDLFPIPIPIPGFPVKIVFTLPDGTQSDGESIVTTQSHPYTGHQLIATVNEVPDGIEALTLANSDLINKLENAGDVKVDVVGRYYDNGLNDITVKTFIISPVESCSGMKNTPLSRQLCLTNVPNTPIPVCSIDASNRSTGAPIVYGTTKEKFLLGYKKKNLNYLVSCTHWAAASQYTDWLALSNAKQEGLSIATAYDLGERPLLEPHNLTVAIENKSDTQKFEITNVQFKTGDHFKIGRNSCNRLLPGDTCEIAVYGHSAKPITYEDMLNMDINGKKTGTYIIGKSISSRLIRDDHTSLWSMRGWTKSDNHLFGSVSFNGLSTDSPNLERTKYLTNPKNVTITYRASGSSQWAMFLDMSRQGLFGDGPTIMPANALNGTNGQWATKTFNISEPGTYKASIMRILPFFAQADEFFDAEISNICFNDCAD